MLHFHIRVMSYINAPSSIDVIRSVHILVSGIKCKMAASIITSQMISYRLSSTSCCQPLRCGFTTTKGYSRMSSFAAGSQRQVGAGICTGPKTQFQVQPRCQYCKLVHSIPNIQNIQYNQCKY